MVTNHRIILLDERKAVLQRRNVESFFQVHKKGQFFASIAEAVNQRCCIALMDSMCNEAQACICLCKGGNNHCRLICTCVIDDNHFKVLHPASKCLKHHW